MVLDGRERVPFSSTQALAYATHEEELDILAQFYPGRFGNEIVNHFKQTVCCHWTSKFRGRFPRYSMNTQGRCAPTYISSVLVSILCFSSFSFVLRVTLFWLLATCSAHNSSRFSSLLQVSPCIHQSNPHSSLIFLPHVYAFLSHSCMRTVTI